MNKMKVFDKQLNLTYSHSRTENRIGLNATLLLDSANKLWGSYGFGSGDCKVKYSFVQGGIRTIEPCYDFSNNSWDISVSQRVLDGDLMKAFYKTSSKVLGLEWSSQSLSNQGGRFKVYNHPHIIQFSFESFQWWTKLVSWFGTPIVFDKMSIPKIG